MKWKYANKYPRLTRVSALIAAVGFWISIWMPFGGSLVHRFIDIVTEKLVGVRFSIHWKLFSALLTLSYLVVSSVVPKANERASS
jgi:hypothetical protein